SRTEVSAIEIERLVPSVAAALSLATALGCRVEDLFGLAETARPAPEWAWPPASEPYRFWQAEVRGRILCYPVEATGFGAAGHDGVCRNGKFRSRARHSPDQTLVMASCDPAAALLSAELERLSDFRLIVLPRASGEALRLLGLGLVHLAGVHLSAGRGSGNAQSVQRQLGAGYSLLHVAQWEAGLAVSPLANVKNVKGALEGKLRWIGREPGSGARQCLDELLDGRPAPKRIAQDHRGVAEAVRNGWADVGVCLRLTAEEAGLKFLGVRNETYDICFATEFGRDPRTRALLEVVRSTAYRRMLGELPGYSASHTGEIEAIGGA
ncbi:MAG TPA: substrate-binding domain-containing protein, partial [Planctomycetaceae bacterium]|nr:substrate-binding domain-containing protein [Planctomycetaceae bacterium]